MTHQALHSWIVEFSANLLCKSCQSWMGTIGPLRWMKLVLWLGRSKIFSQLSPRPVLSMSIVVMLESKASAQSEVLRIVEHFLIEDICILLHSAYPQPWPISQSLLLKSNSYAYKLPPTSTNITFSIKKKTVQSLLFCVLHWGDASIEPLCQINRGLPWFDLFIQPGEDPLRLRSHKQERPDTRHTCF